MMTYKNIYLYLPNLCLTCLRLKLSYHATPAAEDLLSNMFIDVICN